MTARPNHPPGKGARAEAAKLLAGLGPEVLVDLGRYADLAATGTEVARRQEATG